MLNGDKIKYTSQQMNNSSFDETSGMNAVEIVGADGLVKNPATEAKQLPDNHQVSVSNMIAAVETGLAKQVVQTDGSQKTKIVDPAGNELEVVKQNDTYNAGIHGIAIFGAADTGAGPDKYVQIRVHDDGALLAHSIDSTDVLINPALKEGNIIKKKTTALASSGTVLTPTSGKKLRIYNLKFSLSADLTDVAFKFASGTAFEKFLAPKSGGLYGTNLHPNYNEGVINEALNCDITGTGTVQTNVDYIEI